MGPSWYWMPDVFEKFFNDFGKTTNDFYKLKKLNPAYRVYFGSEDYIDIEDDIEKISVKFEKIEKGSGMKLKNSCKKLKKITQLVLQTCCTRCQGLVP